MHLSGDRAFAAPRQAVWNTLLNPDDLARAMPGVKNLRQIGPDQYEATMEVKIAAIGGTFTGKIALLDLHEPTSYVMTVEGGGKPGHVKGEGTLRLDERDGRTIITYDGDVHVAGLIASVGQRLLGVSAKTMIGRFFNGIETQLKQAGSANG